tara:strand:- start:703 stop:1389 length:687 start_codon:yes stop_codon:yes gene_type:complete
MIFLKNKPLRVDCYTDYKHAYEMFPIQKSVAAKPELHSGDLKRCIGLQNIYKQGFVMPLWTDINIKMAEIGDPFWSAHSADEATQVAYHPNEQFGTVINTDKYQNFKVISPWALTCTEDVKFISAPLLWQFDTLPGDVKVLNGVTDFKYQHTTNFIFLHKKGPRPTEFTLHCGTPLYQFIPLTERKIDLRLHLVTPQEWLFYSDRSSRISFTNNYLKVKAFSNKRNKP